MINKYTITRISLYLIFCNITIKVQTFQISDTVYQQNRLQSLHIDHSNPSFVYNHCKTMYSANWKSNFVLNYCILVLTKIKVYFTPLI